LVPLCAPVDLCPLILAFHGWFRAKLDAPPKKRTCLLQVPPLIPILSLSRLVNLVEEKVMQNKKIANAARNIVTLYVVVMVGRYYQGYWPNFYNRKVAIPS